MTLQSPSVGSGQSISCQPALAMTWSRTFLHRSNMGSTLDVPPGTLEGKDNASGELAIMKKDFSALTNIVLAKSAAFATRMRRDFPAILCDVEHYSNDAFPLRSFVSLRGDNQGDELALTIDVTTRSVTDTGTVLRIESDLCFDDGNIIATGPDAQFDTSSPTFELEVRSWGTAFDAFLVQSQGKLSRAMDAILKTRSAGF